MLARFLDLGNLNLELFEIFAAQVFGCGSGNRQRIDSFAVAYHFVMQMRSGRTAGGTDISDQLSLFDADAGPNSFGKFLHVTVCGGIFRIVANFNVIAVAAVILGHLNDAVSGRIDQ